MDRSSVILSTGSNYSWVFLSLQWGKGAPLIALTGTVIHFCLTHIEMYVRVSQRFVYV